VRKVEVREGPSWSQATYVRKEGRQTVLIRYEDGTRSGSCPTRMRALKGEAPKAGPGSAKADPPCRRQRCPRPRELECPRHRDIFMDRATPPKTALPSIARLGNHLAPAPTSAPFVKAHPVPETRIEKAREFRRLPRIPPQWSWSLRVPNEQGQQILVAGPAETTGLRVRPIDTQQHELLGGGGPRPTACSPSPAAAQ